MGIEIYGLVLAGGRSERMGRDKAQIAYEGRTQLARTLDPGFKIDRLII